MFIKMKKMGVKSFLVFAFMFVIVTGVIAFAASSYVAAPIDHGTLGVSDTLVVGNILQITTGDPIDLIQNTREWIPCWGVNPWSKDGEWIVFQSRINGSSDTYNEICIVKADGTGYQRLTNNSYCDTHGNFTPDGKKIVFQRSGDSGYSEIWIMDRDGSNQDMLTDNHDALPPVDDCTSDDCGPSESKPVISPDGKKIAFRHSGRMWVMTIDGTSPVLVSGELSGATKHSWSPDSKWVLFNASECGADGECGQKIFKVNPNGTNLTNLSGNDGDNLWCDNWPAWSPDGTKISFHRGNQRWADGEETYSQLWVMNTDGSGKTKLVEMPDVLSLDGEWVCGPHSWHPGSQFITFKQNVDGSYIYMVNVIDGNIKQLTKDYSDGRMWWGPTGDKILFKEYNSSSTTSGSSRDGGLYSSDLLIINLISDFAYSGGSVGDTGSGGGGGGGCFIATAAFGSPLAGQVEILRQFRDKYLLTNTLGKKFVSWYYRNGPIAANWIKDKPLAKAAVQAALYPLIGFSFLLISGYLPLLTVGLLLSTLVFLRFRPKKLSNI